MIVDLGFWAFELVVPVVAVASGCISCVSSYGTDPEGLNLSASHPNEYSTRGTKSSWRHWKRKLKRMTARAMRRIGKRLLDDAPSKITMGRSD